MLMPPARRFAFPAPPGGATQRRHLVAQLRQAIRSIEQRPETLEDGGGRRPFGIPEIDEALGGGLMTAALHEIAATSEPAVTATGVTNTVHLSKWEAIKRCSMENAVFFIPTKYLRRFYRNLLVCRRHQNPVSTGTVQIGGTPSP